MKRYCYAFKIKNFLSLGLALMVALALPIAAIADDIVSSNQSCPKSGLESFNHLQSIEIEFYDAIFEGDYLMAYRCANQLVRHKPDQPKYHIFLGQSTLRLGELGKAIRAFRTAVDLDPEYAIAYVALANGLVIQGDHDAAIAALEQASQLKPNHLEISLPLAMLYEASEKYEYEPTVYAVLLEMIAVNPESDLFHYELGMFKFLNAIDDGGASEFRRALQINPDYTEAQGWLEHAEREYVQSEN